MLIGNNPASHGLGRVDEVMRELALRAPDPRRQYYYCYCFALFTHRECLFPAPPGLPQASAESSSLPPGSAAASLAQPKKNAGQVPTSNTTSREPTRQAASSESEEAGGAGEWGWPASGTALEAWAWSLALGHPNDTTPSPRWAPGGHAVHHEAERGAHRPHSPPEEPPVRGGQWRVRGTPTPLLSSHTLFVPRMYQGPGLSLSLRFIHLTKAQ